MKPFSLPMTAKGGSATDLTDGPHSHLAISATELTNLAHSHFAITATICSATIRGTTVPCLRSGTPTRPLPLTRPHCQGSLHNVLPMLTLDTLRPALMMANRSRILKFSGHPLFIEKETADYRIVTETSDNWFIVANRDFVEGEFIVRPGTDSYLLVEDARQVQLILRQTGESRLVSTTTSAVPAQVDCRPTALELPWCFMNHSCSPNTQSRWDQSAPFDLSREVTQARVSIAAGDELTFDYALEQYRYGDRAPCWCRAETCRGKVAGFSDLEPEQQLELLPEVSPFVRSRYSRDSKAHGG